MIYAHNGDSVNNAEYRATLLRQGRTVIHGLPWSDYMHGDVASVEAFATTILADFSALAGQLRLSGVSTIEPTRECLGGLVSAAEYCFGKRGHCLQARCKLIESQMTTLPGYTGPPVQIFCAEVEIFYWDNDIGEYIRYETKYPVWKLGTRTV